MVVLLAFKSELYANNQGTHCLSCHANFKIGGTVYADTNGVSVSAGISYTFIKPNGSQIIISPSNSKGNFYSTTAPIGDYLIRIGNIQSKTWHNLPSQASCNTCHIPGGNGTSIKTKVIPNLHTSIPSGNNCKNCHNYPVTMDYSFLKTKTVLNTQVVTKANPASQVQIGTNIYIFNPDSFNITSVRPDIFNSGYYSMFDVILVVAAAKNIPVDYYWDDSSKTHWITKVGSNLGNWWYHFSYDAGSGNTNEINYKRANRWDEALWRPGVWIKLVNNENTTQIRTEYLEEIQREKTFGKIIPSVKFTINPSNFYGNPIGSGRISVTKEFFNVLITPHNFRSSNYQSPYSKPFKPGVVTSMDIPLSLMDSGYLNAVTGVFYNHFNGNYIDSYYIVELGFPGVGTAHSSGRQGFVYVTENGIYPNLPNEADSKLHMTCDINVIHSPDFSYWRWVELGNPYYEDTVLNVGLEKSIDEDFYAINRGFNLHNPFPNPAREELNISFNIFDPEHVEISIYNFNGQKISTLKNEFIHDLGIHRIKWKVVNLPAGTYFLLMKYGKSVQEKRVVIY